MVDRIPAKAILKKKVATASNVSIDKLVDDLGSDLGRIEVLIQALSGYKDDVFSNGIGNIRKWMTAWPTLRGLDADHPFVTMNFHDTFRPRSFALQIDLRTGEYSAEGSERVEKDRPKVQIEITDTLLRGLKSRINDVDRKRIEDLILEWQSLHPKAVVPSI